MGLALRKPAEPWTAGPPRLDFHLHPKQWDAFESEANELLYGGAAGGGKSYLMRVAAITWALEIPGLQIYLFRRVQGDLLKNHMEGPKGFRALLAPLTNCKPRPVCWITEDEIKFPNGSKIYLCHCKDPKHVYKYQGAEIHVLLIDELTHWLEDMYRFLRNRVRMVGITLPEKYRGCFPRILCSANPGNIGHLWVKNTFIDGRVPHRIYQEGDDEGGMRRQYIPARLDDNPSLGVDDPGYEKRLQGLGSPALVRAMRYGDWDIIEGAFFSEWDNNRHVLVPFELPADWTRFVAVDWGSYRPFSVGWYAVAGDDCPAVAADGRRYIIPRGSLIRYREWYGAAKDRSGKTRPNTGIKMPIEQFGIGILKRSMPDLERRKANGKPVRYAYITVDPAMFNEDGGPSLAERLIKPREDLGYPGMSGIRPADNARVGKDGAMGGWDILRARLRGIDYDAIEGPGPNWQPLFYVFNTNVEFIRTVPALQHDPDNPEDLDTDGEDHVGDEARYASKSRPYQPYVPVPKAETKSLEYEAVKGPDGTFSVRSNISIREHVERKMKARKRKSR